MWWLVLLIGIPFVGFALYGAFDSWRRLHGIMRATAILGADESLNITCAIGVDLTARPKKGQPVDPVVQSFILRAESGEDKDATLLNLLEGDIANGGFLQLYKNKGERFIQAGIALLRRIGSRSALRIVEQALMLIQKERATLENYERLLKKLDRLDSRFWRLKESIPVLYERYRQQREG